MPGIIRIHITNDFYNDEQTRLSEIGEPISNSIYRATLEYLQMPLISGQEIIQCSKDEALARYDWSEGIDVILSCEDGSRITMQEKFLDPPSEWRPTVTIELYKASGKPGAWNYCTAQWYFVGNFNDDKTAFEDWVIINLPALRIAHAQRRIPHQVQQPRNPRRGGPFLYWFFRQLPQDVVVTRATKPTQQIKRTITQGTLWNAHSL